MNEIMDIPKVYTALAEWAGCLTFVLILKPRFSKWVTAGCMGVLLVLLCAVQYAIGVLPVSLWIPGMLIALGLMFLSLLICCELSLPDTGFIWAIAFLAGEFAAALEWQVYSFFYGMGFRAGWVKYGFLIVFYLTTFILFYHLESKRFQEQEKLQVTVKEACSAVVIGVGVFLISNISYVYTHTPFSGRMSTEIFYIRTLVDFAGVVILLAFQDRVQDLQVRQTLNSIQGILQRQHEYYLQSKASIELINQKYHDLKYQIEIIRQEPHQEMRDKYLNEIEEGIKAYEAQNKTGNSVLDTILTGKNIYCLQHDITMKSVVDGTKLHFMEVMDICSIFGNALDNAIESVEKMEDADKRIIRVAVFSQNDLLMIRIENYFETQLKVDGGVYVTTKKNKKYHGYGIKSICYTAEKYGGTAAINTNGQWFQINVLIPIPDKTGIDGKK